MGELVVGRSTAHRVGGLFELEALGDLEVKGTSEPVSAFRVWAPRRTPSARTETPLVGREQEAGPH